MDSPTSPNSSQYPQPSYPDPTAFPPQQQVAPDVAEQMRQQVEWMRQQMQQMQAAQAQMAYEQAQAAAQAQYFAQQGYAQATPPYPMQYYGTPEAVPASETQNYAPAEAPVPEPEPAPQEESAPVAASAEEPAPVPASEEPSESVPIPEEPALESVPAEESESVEEASEGIPASEPVPASAEEDSVPAEEKIPAPVLAPAEEEIVSEAISSEPSVPAPDSEPVPASAESVPATAVGISPSVHCAYGKMWRGFFRFGGRTSRDEFRRAFFANMFVVLVLWAAGSLLACISYAALKCSSISASWASYAFMDACEKISEATLFASFIAGAVVVFFCVASFFPMLTMILRRLRDAGKSPAFLLFALIPFVGAIFLPIWLCFAARKEERVPANQISA